MRAEAISAFARIWSHAEARPNDLAVIDRDRTWTRRELIATAHAYATAIERACLERPAAVVPIVADRTGHAVAAILGALMTGRAFAPLSAQQPAERILKCLDALGSGFALAIDESIAAKTLGDIVLLRRLAIPAAPALPPEPEAPPADALLYILFTSGSTGTPKGVVVDWGNIENTMRWSEDMLDWRPHDVIGCAANLFFDIAMFDVFASWYFGVPLAIYSTASDVARVLDETKAFGVTSIFSVPTFFSQLWRSGRLADPRLASLRRIVSGGDFFPPAHVMGWMESKPDVEIFNVWGPTETSIVNTMHRVGLTDLPRLRRGESPPVGRAHARMPFVLLDENDRIVEKPGTRGEICMLGPCVTRGYLGDPETTARSYVEIGADRAFRTQDLGFVDDAGNLYILGRMGSTVKVAGYRVDLAEIEHAAAALPGVHIACAFVHEVADDLKELWLAIEAQAADSAPDIFTLKQQLRTALPAYMVPKRVLVWKALPRNANGKIDRRETASRAAA